MTRALACTRTDKPGDPLLDTHLQQRPSNLAKASLLLSSPVAEQRPLTPHSIHRVPYKQPLQPQTYLLYPFYTRIRHYNYSITRLF